MIEKYIIKRIVKIFFSILIVIFSLLWFINFNNISKMPIFSTLSIFTLLYSGFCLTPFFLFHAYPYIILFTIIFSFNTLVQSGEFGVIKFCWINIENTRKLTINIIKRSLFFVLLLFFIFPFFSTKYLERTNSSNKYKLVSSLKVNSINKIEGNMIFFESISKDNALKNLIIIKRENEKDSVIISKKGLILDSKNSIVLELLNFTMNKKDKINEKITIFQSEFGDFLMSSFLDVPVNFDSFRFLNLFSFFHLIKISKISDELRERAKIEVISRINIILLSILIPIFSIHILSKQINYRISKSYYSIATLIMNLFLIINNTMIWSILFQKGLFFITWMLNFAIFLIAKYKIK